MSPGIATIISNIRAIISQVRVYIFVAPRTRSSVVNKKSPIEISAGTRSLSDSSFQSFIKNWIILAQALRVKNMSNIGYMSNEIE